MPVEKDENGRLGANTEPSLIGVLSSWRFVAVLLSGGAVGGLGTGFLSATNMVPDRCTGEQCDKMSADIERLQGQFAGLQQRIEERLDRRYRDRESRFDNIEKRLTQLEFRESAVETEIAGIKQAATDIRDVVFELDKKIDRWDFRFNFHQNNLNGLKDWFGNIKSIKPAESLKPQPKRGN